MGTVGAFYFGRHKLLFATVSAAVYKYIKAFSGLDRQVLHHLTKELSI
jgi:hypothetical protein